MRPAKLVLFPLCAALILTGCSALKKAARVRTPDLSVESVRLAGLSFGAVDLVFAIAVDNPNPLPVTLAGFDYDLRIEGNSFLKGKQEEPTRITALGKSVVPLPLTLDFGDLRRAFASLKDQDSTAYELVCELVFDLPVLGERRLPLRHSGRVPVVRPPRIRVGDLKIKKLNLTGADLELHLQLDNPNPFGLALDRLDYQLAVSGKPWASGATDRPVTLDGKSAQTVTLPVSLDFVRMGRAAYRALTKKKPLDYHLTGRLDLATSLPLLPHATLPLDLSGTLDVLNPR